MKAAVLALAIVASITLAGCGGADLSSVAEAAARTQEARTARVAMAFRQEGSPSKLQRVDGAVDFANRQLELEIVGLGRVIIDGTTMYISAPAYIRRFTGGRPWLKDDLTKAGNESSDLDADELFEFLDPIQMLDFLGAGVDTEEVGSDTVRGIATVRYRGTIDVATFAAEFMSAADVPADTLDDEVGVEVWVGSDGLLRRVVYEIPTIGDERGGSFRVEFSDIGSDLGITVPSPDEVADLSSVEKREGKS